MVQHMYKSSHEWFVLMPKYFLRKQLVDFLEFVLLILFFPLIFDIFSLKRPKSEDGVYSFKIDSIMECPKPP